MTYDCQLIEDLLPLYVDGLLSGASRDLVDDHLATCADCRDLLSSLEEDRDRDLVPLASYDVPVEEFSKKIKRYRRWVKIVVALALVLMALAGSVITLFLVNSPFDYVSAELGNVSRSSKQIEDYLDDQKLPSFLPRSADEISLTFMEKSDLVNGKFHLSASESQKAQRQLETATVADLQASQEALPDSYNGVKTLLETAPAGASYYQDDQFVYVFMTDGTVYYYGK